MIFFVITHTCAQIIRELRFWWKNFLCLPVEWCKWHINIVSSLNNIVLRNEIELDSRHRFWLLVKKIINEIEKICSANLLKKNLPVSNSILPTIIVPFFSRLQKCEAARPQYNQYGVFSFCLVLFIYNCVVIDYFRWLFLLLLFFFSHTVLLSWILVIFIPISMVFHICACFQNPKIWFFCWLYGKMAIRTCQCLKPQIKFHFSLKNF